ncbi:MAG TPA: hypothetical protein VK190_10220 [Pseudoneobacillus sp.]|nr:hypothetical protein [Pseudoneobacillus sp.]
MYFHPYDQSYYPTYDFQNQDLRQFPGGGFPGGGFPGGGFPGGGGGQTDRRLDRLERQVERLDRRVDQLNRRLRRVERQLNFQNQEQW